MEDLKRNAENVIKRLEKEIASLDTDYVSLLRKKWKMEDEIRVQKQKIAHLEIVYKQEEEKRGGWKKIALLLAASWAVFLSFCGIDRK